MTATQSEIDLALGTHLNAIHEGLILTHYAYGTRTTIHRLVLLSGERAYVIVELDAKGSWVKRFDSIGAAKRAHEERRDRRAKVARERKKEQEAAEAARYLPEAQRAYDEAERRRKEAEAENLTNPNFGLF